MCYVCLSVYSCVPCMHECIMCVSMHICVHMCASCIGECVHICLSACVLTKCTDSRERHSLGPECHMVNSCSFSINISANDKCNHYLFRSTAILASTTVKALAGNSDRTWRR